MTAQEAPTTVLHALLLCVLFTTVPLVVSAHWFGANPLIQQTDYTVSVNVSETVIGNSITVEWSAPAEHLSNDYLCLAKTDSNSCSWTQQLGSATAGSANVTVPSIVSRYEVRMIRSSGSVRLATSQAFVANKAGYSLSASPLSIPAGGQILVTWNGPTTRPTLDRIALKKSTGVTIFQQYVGGTNPPSPFPITVPVELGSYNVEYLEADATNPSAVCQIITVTQSAGGIVGQVTTSSGTYVVGAQVEALQQEVVKFTALTNGNGSYSLALSEVGTYDLRVTATGFPTANRSGVVVAPGDTAVADFVLSDRGAIGGTVSQQNGAGIGNAVVNLKQGSTVVDSKITSFSGSYNFSGIMPGTYSIDVTSSGYDPASLSNLVVSAGVALTANITLTGNQQATSDLEYVYDPSGRLVATKELGVLTRIYRYDPTGNLLSILPPSATAPAIVNFSPGSGAAGTSVEIRGINFGGQVNQNTVTFNGANAQIVSASVSTIVAIVPSNAATGPIVVTASGGSASTSTAFQVETSGGNQTPTITGFAPLLGHPGDPITLTGSNFESEPVDNSIRIGQVGTPVTSATNTSLTFPAGSSSGKVSVTTPNGNATSVGEFVSIPAEITLNRISSVGRTWFGRMLRVEVVGGDKYVVHTFEATAGKRISLQGFAVTNRATIEIYRPDGKLLKSATFSQTLGADNWFMDTQTIPLTGTYTIMSRPATNESATYFSMMLYDVPPDYVGEMGINTYKTVSFGTPGQNGSVSFHAEAAQKFLINIEDNTYSGRIILGGPPNGPILGATILNYTFRIPSGGLVDLNYSPDGVTFPATGTYTISLDPDGPATGPMTVSIYTVPPDPEYTMVIGSTKSVLTSNRGQNATITFSGTAGQRISLRTPVVDYPGGYKLSITKPDGSLLAGPIQANNNSFIDTNTLPTTGVYKIFVNPDGYDTGNTTIELFDVPPDVVGTTSVGGSPVVVVASIPGHNPSLTFDGLLGQQARVNVSGATVPSGTNVRIYKPDGVYLTSTTVNSSGTAMIQSITLPVNGTYKVQVDPSGANLGSATIAVGGDVFGTVTPGGSAATTTITSPGQSGWLTFNGTLNQRISVKLTNVTIQSGSVSIRKPDGSIIGNTLQIGSNNNFIDTVTLPVAGQYKVLIDPGNDDTGSATVNVYNVPSDTQGAINVGDSLTRTTTVPGQNLSFTLTGTANQKITFELMNSSISSGELRVNKPDGTRLASDAFGAPGDIIQNIVLPLAGNYEILVNPNSDAIGVGTIRIFGNGTGGANPTVGLFQSVSVLKGLPVASPQWLSSTPVSVTKGYYGGAVSSFVRSDAVSVSTGPVLNSVSPLQITRATTVSITISGNNLGAVNVIRFHKSDGSLDTTITVTNIAVNTEGTELTATVQSTSSTTTGVRVIVVTTPSSGFSQTEETTINVVNITQ